MKTIYHNNPKYWDKEAFANSAAPNQMLHSAESDTGEKCLYRPASALREHAFTNI